MTATSREKLYQCVIVSGCGLDYSLLLLLLMLFVHRGVVSRVLPAVVSFSVGSRFYSTVVSHTACRMRRHILICLRYKKIVMLKKIRVVVALHYDEKLIYHIQNGEESMMKQPLSLPRPSSGAIRHR